QGNAAFKAGDYPAAIGHYTAAIIANSAEPTYFLNRAAAYLKLGKNEDAERDCTTVLKLDEKNVKALFRRGQARVALQKLHEAEAGERVDLSKSASAGVKAPMSLFTFQQRWEQLESVEARWALINEIPSPALPALFQSSLDASLLSSILSTFLSILRSSPINAVGEADPTLSAEDMRVRVRAYLVWLARVPRFGTVVLFMSPDERRLVQDVWSAVGVGVVKKGAGAMAVEGDTKEVEEGRKAWGAS
ncbi:TPR-like protein, partial [Obba rivulosa]